MTQINVVDSLVQITNNQDISLLEQSLVNTIYQLYPEIEVRLYNVSKVEHKISIHLIASAKNDAANVSSEPKNIDNLSCEFRQNMFVDVIKSKKIESFKTSSSVKYYIFYPILDENSDVFAVLVISSEKNIEEESSVLSGMLHVYANYLNLLNRTQKDKLTGLYNRETLDQQILHVLHDRMPANAVIDEKVADVAENRRKSNKLKTYLGVIDIDHFKNINDNFGHLYGDEILVLVARFMKENFTRVNDLVYRYGGEEFVILLKADDTEHAQAAFERLRINIENYDFPQVGNVTVSIGFEEVNGQKSPQEVISLADKALYFAKETGRNATHNYSFLVENGDILPVTIKESEEPILF